MNSPVRGKPSSSSYGGVQSVEKALRLLEVMASSRGEVTVSELAAVTQIPLPTAHRLVRTLVAAGYARQLATRRYALGPALLKLNGGALDMLATSARPFLTALVREVGETANLALLDGDSIVYIAQAPSPHSMRMFTEVGRRTAPHGTGVGKAILAQMPRDFVLELLARTGMAASTDRTFTDVGPFVAELDTTRELGYAIDDGEQERGVRCIAVHVPTPSANLAISVSGPAGRLSPNDLPRIAPTLQSAAAEFAHELGGTPLDD